MKKKLFLLLATALSVTAVAQPSQNARQRVESMKIGFLTERLDLSPEEARAFWPVYNQYSDALETLRKTRRENLLEARKEIDTLSDKEIEKLVDNELTFRQNELDIMKKYHPQFKQVLPVRKVARLYKSEEEFKRKLLDMLQEKRNPKRQPMK